MNPRFGWLSFDFVGFKFIKDRFTVRLPVFEHERVSYKVKKKNINKRRRRRRIRRRRRRRRKRKRK